jgi:hypothetical protein
MESCKGGTLFAVVLAVCAAAFTTTDSPGAEKEWHEAAAQSQDGQQQVITDMRSAASALLDSLGEDLRQQASFDLNDEERKKWSNLPATVFKREGVSFGEMTPKQRVLTHHLIQSPLSSQGYLKAAGIMRVDEILKEMAASSRPGEPPMFGQELYWIGIFGDPAKDKAWGWQLDGHHLALNFTVIGDEISVTPVFLGSDPAEIRTDLDTGWYVLAKEDSRGRRLFDSLDGSQKARVLLKGATPRDVIAGPGRADRLKTIHGLPAAEMTAAQRGLLMLLLHEYLNNLEPDLATVQADRIARAGDENLHFSWSGTEAGKPYYYRIHGPTILIEFDNSYAPGRQQGPVNHIHTVWRDIEHDYGEDLLRKHYEKSPHHQQDAGDSP